MNNGLPGPSTTDTITGGKTLELSAYDRIRRPHRLITDDTTITIGPRTLSAELTCPICLDLLTNTMTTKECLHRFCEECIKNALMRGNKECPTCRKKIVSKRSLRHDTNFDALISTIWPDRREYERMQEASLRLFQEKSNINALQQSIEAGMKAQAATRRMRVQGSYDYEKRRKRPAVSVTNGAGSSSTPVPALNNDAGEMLDGVEDSTAADVDDDDVENADAAATTDRGGRDTIASSTSETSDTTEETIESSEVSISASGQSEERSGASALSSPSHSSVQEAAAQSTRAKTAQIAKRVTGAAAKLPSTSSSLNDKMSKWLNENQKCDSPTLDENLEDSTQSSSIANNFESRLLDMRRKDEEIEVELAPAKSMLRRAADVSPSLLHSWFISASPDITIGHIGEYLFKMTCERDEPNASAVDRASSLSDAVTKDLSAEKARPSGIDVRCGRAKDATRPAYFYILNHNNQVRKIFLHETLYSAFITSQLVDDHMRIFYDTQPPDVNSSSRLVTEIVNEDFACATNNSSLTSAIIKDK